jgi:putative membrane protein insertion efficiency factor
VAKRVKIALALLALLLVVDLTRDPESQVSARLLLGGIQLYRATLSPLMPYLGVTCRFEPSCSRYGEVSIQRYGAVEGTWRTLARLARCGPWTPMGTPDPP